MWVVGFDDGSTGTIGMSTAMGMPARFYVRCVR
jgi:hypothetical protein